VFGRNRRQKVAKAVITSLITVVLVFSLISCGDRFAEPGSGLGATTPIGARSTSTAQSGNISEVSPPEVIQQLRQALESYQPQVTILSPQTDEILQDNTVTARFQVQDLPIFKNPDLDMGPHLHVILDNQPYIAVYDLNQPLVFPDLAPGTHTLRVFASRPWHESFKNEGAYAQTTFHIFTKTDDNNPDPAQPLLTYSRPKGSYGAEPILLDFYLTNAPLHLVAQENSNDEIADWRIRCTINGSSFFLDRWIPIYLTGFKQGKNWVQLEFLDEQGNPVKNTFNNTVRVITYEPKGRDTLSKLVRGELSADEARGIVDQNAAKVPATPAPIPSPTPSAETTGVPVPGEEKAAEPETVPQLEPTPEPQSLVTPEETTSEVEPSPLAKPESKEFKPERQKSPGFLNRFRRPDATPPSLPPTLPEIIDAPSSELVAPEAVPQPDSAEPESENLTTESDAPKPKLDIKEIILP
jgi:uncharacterized lipoprotein NlpE involved in copper resistance